MKNKAFEIVHILQHKGFEAFWVGGCVRDKLLGLEPKDYDIVTNALPEDIEKIFKKTYPIGKAFGVILIEESGHHYEIATFREDQDYEDGRHPKNIEFSTPEQDALRRDFTINGLFYDPIDDKYIDYIGGKEDLKNKLLRFIGDPDKRINEDFLRILRAVRFKNRFDLQYEYDTGTALKRHAALVTNIANERILDELNKIIIHKSRHQSFKDLFEFGILQKLFPNTEKMAETDQPEDHHLEGDVLTHTLLVLQNMPEDLDSSLYWAAFFHDWGKPSHKKFYDGRWHFPGHDDDVDEIIAPRLAQLKFSKKSQEKILWLLRYKQIFETFEDMKLSRRLHYYDHPWFEELWLLEMADINGCIAKEKKAKKQAIERMNRIKDNAEYAKKQGILPSHQDEFFSGEEIILITGIKPGKKVGEIKNQLRELQLEGELKNRVEAETWLKEQGPT